MSTLQPCMGFNMGQKMFCSILFLGLTACSRCFGDPLWRHQTLQCAIYSQTTNVCDQKNFKRRCDHIKMVLRLYLTAVVAYCSSLSCHYPFNVSIVICVAFSHLSVFLMRTRRPVVLFTLILSLFLFHS